MHVRYVNPNDLNEGATFKLHVRDGEVIQVDLPYTDSSLYPRYQAPRMYLVEALMIDSLV